MSGPSGSVPGAVPGERLRAERERRGFSTQKVAEALHVDAWVVEALESGRHATLGAPVYVKGHLRKYAAFLGLDAEALVAACSDEDPPLVMLKPRVRRRRPVGVPVKRILIGVLVLAVLAGGVWAYRAWRERAAVAPAPVEQPAPAIAPAGAMPAASMASPVTPAVAERLVPTAMKVSERPASAVSSGPGGMPKVRVRLSFSADSWVELYDATQRRVFFDLGVANTARSFTVTAPARLFLGYADAVQVELDGRPVNLVDEVRRGNVAHFTFDARGRLKPAGSLTGR